MKKFVCIAALAYAVPAPALAAPGLGQEVYGATVEKGEREAEIKFDTLSGGPENGESVIKLEAAYGVSDRLRIGVLAEFEREAGGHRSAEEIGIEAIYTLGNAGGIDFALYGEYAIGLHGADALETKLLMQHRQGPFDLRLNLIAKKPLDSAEKLELSYAASADFAALGELRLGLEAYGDLGTFSNFAPHAEHFIGPMAKFRIPTGDRDGDDDGDLGVSFRAGYLFALAKAQDDTDGQFRLALELEF